MAEEFQNKLYLITGATGGIGLAVATKLYREGARLILVGRTEEKLAAARDEIESYAGASSVKNPLATYYARGGGEIEPDAGAFSERLSLYPLELEKDAVNIQAVVKDACIQRKLGPLDGFVHCAGFFKAVPAAVMKQADIDRMLQVNFMTYIKLAQAVADNRCHSKSCSCVGISSVAAEFGAPTQFMYSATKAAMDGAMRSLARELGSRGIRFNNVAPAATDTKMIRAYYELRRQLTQAEPGVSARQYLGMNKPEDVADAVLFLLSDRAKKITGITLPVDGGFSSC